MTDRRRAILQYSLGKPLHRHVQSLRELHKGLGRSRTAPIFEIGVRWYRKIGQVVKLGSPQKEDEPDDGRTETVWRGFQGESCLSYEAVTFLRNMVHQPRVATCGW